ncbi:MAG: hypothetical protein ABIR34_06595 [Marmoricola sp.]
MLTPVRRRLAALALVLLVPSLGACAHQTDQVYQPGVGVNNRQGAVDVLGAVVVSGTDGSGTFVASLVNKDLDKPAALTTITGANGLTVQVTKTIQIAPDSLVNLADLGAASVSGEPVKAGGFARLTLEFDTGQSTKMNVPIVNKDGEFSGVHPATPSSSATP